MATKLPGTRSREIALVALANYSKFAGKYKEFQELKARYNLKWNQVDPLKSFERFFNEQLTLDVMLDRIKEMIRLLPDNMGNIIRYACLTGLRASEAVESVRLLNMVQNSGRYYNPSRQALEHFRHPEIFIRQTKKCYISYLSTDMYDYFTKKLAKTPIQIPTLNAIALSCRRKGIKMNMHLTRKIFASWLRKEGIAPEIVDLLQGRVSQSILTRHYLVPESGMKDHVLRALEKLQRQL